MIKKFLGTILFLAAALSALATSYYVRTDGNDLNTGLANTAGSAWLTITRSITTANAGDTVNIADGYYNEAPIANNNSGTALNPITFRGASVNAIVFSFEVRKPYITVDRMGFDSSSYGGFNTTFPVGTGGDHCTITNSTFYAHSGTYPGTSGYMINESDYSTTYLTVDHCTFLICYGSAILCPGPNSTITNNTFGPNDWGGDAIDNPGSNAVITGNFYDRWSNNVGNTNHPDLIQVQTNANSGATAQNVLFANNTAIDCANVQICNISDDTGLGYIGQWTFRNNLYIRVGISMSLCTAPYVFFENNTFIQCAQNTGTVLQWNGRGQRWTFTTANVSTGANSITNPSGTLDFVTGDEVKVQGTTVPGGLTALTKYWARVSGQVITLFPSLADANANTNIIDITSTGADGTMPMGISRYPACGTGNNGQCYNNIFYVCGGTPTNTNEGWYGTSESGGQYIALTTPCVADYNYVIGTGAGTTKVGFTETHGINGTAPAFLNAAADNYRLTASSPMVAAGVDLSATFTDDILGLTRTVPWDMGAYKYVAAAASGGSLMGGSLKLGGSVKIN